MFTMTLYNAVWAALAAATAFAGPIPATYPNVSFPVKWGNGHVPICDWLTRVASAQGHADVDAASSANISIVATDATGSSKTSVEQQATLDLAPQKHSHLDAQTSFSQRFPKVASQPDDGSPIAASARTLEGCASSSCSPRRPPSPTTRS